jgi:hypothetical protein
VAVAMEGFNGWARPLDRKVLSRGWRLFNVNNLKLARYKEIFPAPAKTDSIDTRCMLELFRLRTQLGVARDVLQEVAPVPAENDKLKRLTRRRRQLVIEKGRVLNRLQADLQAVCPGLLAITAAADNGWFRILPGAPKIKDLAVKTKSSSLLWDLCGTSYPPVRARLTEFKGSARKTKSSLLSCGTVWDFLSTPRRVRSAMRNRVRVPFRSTIRFACANSRPTSGLA